MLEFHDYVDSYITQLSIKDTSISVNVGKYWGSMLTGELCFREEKELIELAKTCTRDGLISFTKKLFALDSPDHREVIVSIWGRFSCQSDADEAGAKVTFSDVKKVLSRTEFPILCHHPHKVLQSQQ